MITLKKMLPTLECRSCRNFCLFRSKWVNNWVSLPSGNIRNTERLSFEKQQSYQITVTAFDCGQKRAKKDVAVHIDVKPVCKPGWQGQSCRNVLRIRPSTLSEGAILMRIKRPLKTSQKRHH